MIQIEANCDSGDTAQRTLSPDESAAIEATRNEHDAQEQAARAAADAEKQAAVVAQVQAAQALIATSSNQQQADAMTTFMRTLGLPL